MLSNKEKLQILSRRKISPWLAIALLATLVAAPALQAQTYTVLHNFTGGGDGANPSTGLTMDRSGNLYGTTYAGGSSHSGGVFKLKHQGSSYLFSSLYNFAGGSDGAAPYGRLVIGPNGSLYGTTYQGADSGCANGNGCGTVFNLRPPATFCPSISCAWGETVLYRFTGGSDGGNPKGPLVFDSTGNNIYATTRGGGTAGCAGTGCGVVYKLTKSGNNWIQSVVYSFSGGSNDQGLPDSGLIFDPAGNLYGTTQGCYSTFSGTVFELSPAGSGWTYSTLVVLNGGFGQCPVAGLVRDQSGNLYGATAIDGGSVFEGTLSGSSWTFSLIKTLSGPNGTACGPFEALVMDSAGNLYGTGYCNGANSLGSVFKLTFSNGSWTYTDLHDFSGPDGAMPQSNLVIDSAGNLYGTASIGGTGTACTGGCGVAFKITP